MQLVLEKRAERSALIAVTSPLIAIGLTLVTMAILFAILGQNPIAAPDCQFIPPPTDPHTAGDMDRLDRQCRQTPVGKAHRLQAAQSGRIIGQAILADALFLGDDFLDMAQEPRIEVGERVDCLKRHPLVEGQ